MKRRPLLLAFAAAALVVGTVACALDFDQFEPVQGSPDASRSQTPRADAGNEPSPDDASADVSTAAPEQDVAVDDGGVDAGTVADGSRDGSPCTPSSDCLTSAHNCGMGCAQTEQQCAGKCFGGGASSCRNRCTMTETMCITGCENTCSSCVQSAGCSATTRCADAAY
jgi:hypothetical protein